MTEPERPDDLVALPAADLVARLRYTRPQPTAPDPDLDIPMPLRAAAALRRAEPPPIRASERLHLAGSLARAPTHSGIYPQLGMEPLLRFRWRWLGWLLPIGIVFYGAARWL